MAEIAEATERYEDMADFMKQRVELGGALTKVERDMFSSAFKNSMGSYRNAARIAKSIAMSSTEQEHADLATDYKAKMEASLREICENALGLLERNLIPNCGGDPEAKVFYLKMQGDYYRYLAENLEGEARADKAEKAKRAYSDGFGDAQASMSPVHPTYLGLVLNFTVFLHEVIKDTESAVSMATSTLNGDLSGLDSMSEDARNESLVSLNLLKENLSLWAGGN